ncbi:hypothetical protein [Paenibacillus elgii]|uniref:hypothetical protein n=1 Tax=Paenibacillus elgii TaxID=189691 RepID=UPI000FDB75A3|nr:hypothetical protein [Paenibacillus elgii]NEN82798.1 hypothetical protein [Paenibacillus elgii]
MSIQAEQYEYKNPFIIPRDVQDGLSSDSLRRFIIEKKINKPYRGGDKRDRVRLIQEAINNKIISEHDLEVFVSKELKRGKNRTLYICELKYESIRKLQSFLYIQSKLFENGIKSISTSEILKSTRPASPKLAHLNIVRDHDVVHCVSFCYTHKVNLKKFSTDAPPQFDTDFVWIEIDLIKGMVIFRLRERNNSFGKSNDKALFLHYLNQMKLMFDIQTEGAIVHRNTLFKIFRELTAKAEEPFRKKTAVLNNDIEILTSNCIEKLPLKDYKIIEDFRERLEGLILRSMIQENFLEYSSYSEGKRGLIDRYYYTDGTGASVNAKTGDENRSISLYQIYLDTKHSIDKMQLIDKLWVTWYRKKDNLSPLEKIRTKLEVFKECYTIHFLYDHHKEEVENHVFSEFNAFEELQD